MGNVPTKETRSRSNSSVSEFTTNTSSSTKSRRRNTSASLSNIGVGGHQRSNSSDLRKLKRQEEKERNLQHHYFQLIVKYNENVDGGYLAPYGTYKSNLDYDCEIVRKLIMNRQLSPFFTPLQDFSNSWTQEELVILLNQLTLHALEPGFNEVDQEEEDDLDNHKIHKSSNYYKRQEEKVKLKSLIARVKELQKEEESKFFKMKQVNDKQCFSNDLFLRLYQDPLECPICFLYYPKHLNISRCCLQPICTECFVQIKRLDPHPPHDDSSNQNKDELPQTLISEPASCPYCAMPDFGVTYDPPLDISTGIGGSIAPMDYRLSKTIMEENEEDAIIEESETDYDSRTLKVGSPPPTMTSNKIRRSSVPANSPGVITIDSIRPDWESKLNSAIHKLAKKAATATAIHNSNLLIDNGSSSRRRNTTESYENGSSFSAIEQRMIAEAMRLSLIDEEERKKKNAK